MGKRALITAALGLAGVIMVPAYAQNADWNRRDRNDSDWRRDSQRYSGDSRKAYEQGYKDGVWDLQHGPQRRSRSWRNAAIAQAYREGYNAGFRNGRNAASWGNRGGYDYYAGRGYYGGYGARGYFAQQGYIDGMNDGSADRRTGHSFRPTQHPGWRHADRGYVGGMSKDQYKQAYREAYMQGYQRGYYGYRR